jgi:hypothetical protein
VLLAAAAAAGRRRLWCGLLATKGRALVRCTRALTIAAHRQPALSTRASRSGCSRTFRELI